jgi:hypothetical protein
MASAREFPCWTAPDRRVSSSATLFAVVVCATGAFVVLPRAASGPATSASSINRLAEATTPPVVRIIHGAARSDLCAEQTWPYYDRRCRARRNEAASIGAVPAPQSAAVAPSTASGVTPPFTVPAADSLSPVNARQTTGGPAVMSAIAPKTGIVGAAPRANDAAPSSLPAAREPRSEPSGVDMHRDDDRWAASGGDYARRFDTIKPVEQPRRRTARRRHFGIFGFRF